jgi:hypothetical protein
MSLIETREVDQFDLGAGVSFGNQVGGKALAGEVQRPHCVPWRKIGNIRGP